MTAENQLLQPVPSSFETEMRNQPADALQLLSLAVERGVSVDVLERLTALHERISARQAEAAFGAAMAAFQSRCPSIPRTAKTEYIGKKSGVRVSYTYAALDQIAKTIQPMLEECGLSYAWDCALENAVVRCVCTLRHLAGHHVTATFAAPVDLASSMSGPQQVATALSYGRRQSLVQVLGLTTTEPDTDAASVETISSAQVDQLQGLIDESVADATRFLRYMEVGSLPDIKAADFGAAVAALEAKLKRGKA